MERLPEVRESRSLKSECGSATVVLAQYGMIELRRAVFLLRRG